jgi:ACS family hexuronate transporter-like MFS transporter
MNSTRAVAEPVFQQHTRSGSKIRWWIAGLLFCSTVINYMDRQNLSILARTIQNDLSITDIQYGYVVQAFLLAYTIMNLVAGRLTDWLGARRSMAVFVSWWSIADILTSLSRSALSLGCFRFLLGIGEPGNYTAAPKAVSEWFPLKERGFVIGLYTAGATLGATIAPPLVALVAGGFGWRVAFLCTGSLGLLWLMPWLTIYRTPKASETIEEEQPAAGPWREIVSRRETWALLVCRSLTDPVWYFLLFWFPKYLNDSRHLSLTATGRIAWIVYLGADLGCITAGYVSSVLIRRGLQPVASCVRVMAISAILMLLSPLVTYSPTALLATLVAAVGAFGHLSWQTSLSTLIVDLYPKRLMGTVFGLVAAGSGLGSMFFLNIAGQVVSKYSYKPVFIAMAFLHPMAWLLINKSLRITNSTAF